MGEEQSSRAERVFNLETAVFEQAQQAAQPTTKLWAKALVAAGSACDPSLKGLEVRSFTQICGSYNLQGHRSLLVSEGSGIRSKR